MTDPLDPRSRREGGDGPEPPEGRGLDRWIRPYFTDSALWPVTIVLLTSLGMFGAVILLLALRARNVFAIAALVILGVASAEAVHASFRQRRIGAAGILVLALWLFAALIALAAARFGLF